MTDVDDKNLNDPKENQTSVNVIPAKFRKKPARFC